MSRDSVEPVKQILFFGDSLTAGYGLADAKNQSVPGLIQQRIISEKLPYQVINAGLSGDTTIGGLKRLSYWLATPPDIFVLELGINDLLRGIPPATTFQNLQAIINQVKTASPRVKLALMGMTLPLQQLALLAPGFHDIYDRLAAANEIAYVPFYLAGVAGIAALNLQDRLHPNAEGYRIIADNVWPVIQPLLLAV